MQNTKAVRALRLSRRTRESLAAAVFLGPDLIGLIVFVLVPIAFALYVSFFDWNLISDMKFVGIENYERLMADTEWWQSLGRTLQFALIYVPVLFAISLALALAFTRLMGRSAAVLRSAYLLPFAVTSVIAPQNQAFPLSSVVPVFPNWDGSPM